MARHGDVSLLKSPTPGRIDAEAMTQRFERFRDSIEDADARRLLDVWCDHLRYELVDKDIDRLMATMVPEPEFQFYGTQGEMPPVVGGDSVREYYLGLFGLQEDMAGMELDDVVVGDNHLVFLGYVLMSQALQDMQNADLGTEMREAGDVVLRKKLCLSIPFRGERMVGEIHYFDGPFGSQDIYHPPSTRAAAQR